MRNIGAFLVKGLHRDKTKAIRKRGLDLVARVQRAGEYLLVIVSFDCVLIKCSGANQIKVNPLSSDSL